MSLQPETVLAISIAMVSLSFIWHAVHHRAALNIWEYLNEERKYIYNLEKRVELLEAHLLYFIKQNGASHDEED